MGVYATISRIFYLEISLTQRGKTRLYLLGLLIACGTFATLETRVYFVTTPKPPNVFEYAISSLYRGGFVISNIMLSVLV